MDVSSTAMAGLDGLRWKEQMLSGEASKKEQVEHLAREFEGVLLRQFLDKALAPMDPDSGLFGAKGSPMHDQLIKDALVTGITQNGSLGFSNVLQAQLFPDNSNLEKGTDSHE